MYWINIQIFYDPNEFVIPRAFLIIKCDLIKKLSKEFNIHLIYICTIEHEAVGFKTCIEQYHIYLTIRGASGQIVIRFITPFS